MGRDAELAVVRQLLATGRLVSVVGAAGVGKSSVARAAAVLVRGALPADAAVEGVLRVPCWEGAPGGRAGAAPDGASGGAATALARALGGGPAGVRDVVDRLRTRRLLVLLDDVDPVHAECIRLVQSVLQHAPGVRVLVTGRQPLGLGEEQVVRLAGLPETAPDGGDGPAVELFLRRARTAQRGFTVDGAGRRLVRELCARLDGAPLAIVLAAAQVERFPLPRLARLVESGQCWLRDESLPERRQRSLRAAMEAQYALCDRAARLVWARLSVAAGDFALDAAVFLCQGGGLDPDEVPACLARLAAAAVLEPVREAGGVLPPRYRMTGAARDFGAERLHAAGESEEAADRHLLWYSRVATAAHDLWRAGQPTRATLLVRDESANIQAALDRAPRDEIQADVALAMALDLWFWWAVCGHAAHGREVVERLLPLTDGTGPLYGRGLCLAAWLAAGTGGEGVEDLLSRAWAAAVLVGDVATAGHVALVQGLVALGGGELERAATLLGDAAHIVPDDPAHGPPAALSRLLLGVTRALRGEPAEGLRDIRGALRDPAAQRDLLIRCLGQYGLALVDHLTGRRSRAWRRAHRAMAQAVSLGCPSAVFAIQHLLQDVERGASGTVARPPGLLCEAAAGSW
ncbi:ATP-binding protein [Streptomyces sp. Da 82-17]|uniref:ATP-binding protein n=1 Tax=Streptomyces sp. Da 82-17 TaxID=3377116 RepID=UPI0038D42877